MSLEKIAIMSFIFSFACLWLVVLIQGMEIKSLKRKVYGEVSE